MGEGAKKNMMDISAFLLSWKGVVGMAVMMFLMELPDILYEWYDKRSK